MGLFSLQRGSLTPHLPAVSAAVPREGLNFLPLKNGSPTWDANPRTSRSQRQQQPLQMGEPCFNFLPLKSGSPTQIETGATKDIAASRFNFLPLKSGSPTALLMRDSVYEGVNTLTYHQHFLLYPYEGTLFYQKSSQIPLPYTLEICHLQN